MKPLPEDLLLPARTITRAGAIAGLLKECGHFGKRGLLVHGHSLSVSGKLETILAATPAGLKVEAYEHSGGEPNLFQATDLLRVARAYNAEWIAGVGGGSVLDLAKTCSGLLHAQMKPVDYHNGAPIPPTKVPFIAVPTTAGTGSEATAVCVLTNVETGVKKSFRHPSFMARLVILDPEALAACPPGVIASSGLDAFTQAIESYTSVGANWFTDSLSIKAVGLIAVNLQRVYDNPAHEAAADLLLGSYFAGIALSNARLGVVHGLAHPLGARYHVPHGLACAACLPHSLEFNKEAIGRKYESLSQAAGNDIIDFTDKLSSSLKIVSPFSGKPLADTDQIVKETLASGSTAANPRKVTDKDVAHLLQRIFA